ncbi:hypothetical protein [Streptomyces sasae]|uniref:hypothetical protein n=1 Tax=Streptomyces sasae TaxID=1266772 RepID=UPI0029316F3A|nr:hypothetical protein [Streptomyces sasae]
MTTLTDTPAGLLIPVPDRNPAAVRVAVARRRLGQRGLTGSHRTTPSHRHR